jgi:hypothetical protein
VYYTIFKHSYTIFNYIVIKGNIIFESVVMAAFKQFTRTFLSENDHKKPSSFFITSKEGLLNLSIPYSLWPLLTSHKIVSFVTVTMWQFLQYKSWPSQKITKSNTNKRSWTWLLTIKQTYYSNCTIWVTP